MTQEEKAKAYDEALERARKLQENSNGMILKKWLWDIFPELKESEDEKIRKRIIALVNAHGQGMYKDEMLAWLEKQGEPFDDNIITRDDEILQAISIGLTDAEKDLGWSDFGGLPIDEIQEWLEKQGEQKPTDKVEPKFKVGDFIVNDYCMGKVIELTSDAYLLDTGQGIPFSCEHNAHLWTIEDAKDGDVLAFKNNIGGTIICKSSTYYDTRSYCRLLNGNLINKEESGWDSTLLVPATKEQRDTLMKAMADAGYTFDFEKN